MAGLAHPTKLTMASFKRGERHEQRPVEMSKYKTSLILLRFSVAKMLKFLQITFIICSLMPLPVLADAVGVEVLLLTAHVSNETIQLGEQYRRKLSKDGRFIITPGVEIYYDKDLARNFLHAQRVRLVTAGYRDSIDHLAGYLALLPRWNLLERGLLRLDIGIGPTLIFRETWNTLPGYRDDGYFHESRGYQYKWIIGGDLDLQYKISEGMQVVWSIVPGIPYVISQSFGVRWSF